jgi:nitrate/nitrite transporter NarK
MNINSAAFRSVLHPPLARAVLVSRMAVVLYSVLAIALAILVVLAVIICTAAEASPKHRSKVEPPVVDLPEIVAPRRRHVAERGVGAAL